MALFCFWTRRACSRYIVLGQPLPPGSKLEAHMEACAECREYWNDLSMLSSDLDRFVSVPRPSPQFAEPIWERVKPVSRAAQWGRLSLAGAAVCGLACGLIWWRFAPSGSQLATNLPIPQSALKPPADDPPKPNQSVDKAAKPEKSAETAVVTKSNSGSRPRLRWTPAPPENRSGTVRRSRRRPLMEREPSLRISPEELRNSGLQYEANGDPGLANVAYQAAYQAQPTEENAFDMGRTAEESGDMEQAMNVYADLLESADAKTQNQKGWGP